MEVPDAPSPNRPRGLRPGLTIHLLEDGRYRAAVESRAFPRLDGSRDSRGAERACAVGADERGAGACGWSAWGRGKEPDRTTTRCCAHNGERGSSEGARKVGKKAGPKPARRWCAQILRSRGIEVSEGFPRRRGGVRRSLGGPRSFRAALACTDQAEFLAALARAER